MVGILVSFWTMIFIMGLGYTLAKAKITRAGAERALTRIAFAGLLPALLFDTVAKSDPHAVFSASAMANVLSATTLALAYGLLAHFAFHMRGAAVTIGALAASYTNAGNLGVAFLLAITGDAAAAAPIMVFQLCVMVPISFSILERQSGRDVQIWKVFLRSFANPPVLGVLAGIVIALTGVHLPPVVAQPVQVLSDAAVPIMLLAIGISMCGAVMPRPGRDLLPLYVAVAMRCLGGPALTYAFGALLGLSGQALLAVTIAGAFPTANNVFVYAHRFRAATTFARDAVLLTTVFSLVVILGISALYHSGLGVF